MLMPVIIFIILLLLALLAETYWLYRGIFCFPAKKRPDAHNIPESNLYRDYKRIMLDCIYDMEQTSSEEVNILSSEGYRLYGKLYLWKEKAPLVLFFHGYHGTPAWDGYGFYNICKQNGINLLMVDERAHGKSEGRTITLGIKERYDCKLWADYAVKRFGEDTELFLAGVSMGAASVMMSTELGLPEAVRAIVADCGYSEPAAILKETIRKMRLPVKPVYLLANLGARMFGHFNLAEAAPLQAMKALHLPILLIHGKQDSVVPLSMSEELFENCNAEKERLLVEGADHANSAMTDYAAYEKAVLSFLMGRCH